MTAAGSLPSDTPSPPTDGQPPAARTATRARAAGSAWTIRIRRETVAAPNSPATITQTRKKSLKWKALGCVATMPTPSPATRNPLYSPWLAASAAVNSALGRQTEGSHPDRFLPEQHLEDEEPQVKGSNECDQDAGDDRHETSSGGEIRGSAINADNDLLLPPGESARHNTSHRTLKAE